MFWKRKWTCLFTPTQKNSKEFAHCCKSTAEMQVGFPLVIFIAWIFISSRLMMEALTVVISKKESFSSYQKTRLNELKIRFDLNLILLTVSWVMKSWKFYIWIALLCDSFVIDTGSRCVKITEKVSFNIASEASYVYILRGQKLIKNVKNGPFWRIFESLKLAVKQCYQRQVSFNETKIGGNCQNSNATFE